jgi:hypothetical protein
LLLLAPALPGSNLGRFLVKIPLFESRSVYVIQEVVFAGVCLMQSVPIATYYTSFAGSKSWGIFCKKTLSGKKAHSRCYGSID